MVKEECLGLLVDTLASRWRRPGASQSWSTHTTMAMPAHCTMPLNSSTEQTIFHPVLLRCTPPAIITMKETRAQSSATTSREIKKPTVFHMLQKYGSFRQSSVRGNGTHLPVRVEQRLWSPMENSRLSFCQSVSEGALTRASSDNIGI